MYVVATVALGFTTPLSGMFLSHVKLVYLMYRCPLSYLVYVQHLICFFSVCACPQVDVLGAVIGGVVGGVVLLVVLLIFCVIVCCVVTQRQAKCKKTYVHGSLSM